jgi:hypothetical protein
VRRTLLVLTVLAVGSGCTSPAPSPSTAAPTSAPPTSSAPAPTPTPTLTVGDITPARVLQVADGGRDPYGYGPVRAEQVAAILRPPCATTAGASEALMAKRATATMSYRFSPPPFDALEGDVSEVLTRYRNDGATRLVAEWRTALAGCAREQVDQVTSDHTVAATGFAGDESILISTVRKGPAPGPGATFTATSYRAVIRIGDAAIVLQVTGWELTSAKREDVDRFVRATLTRATA